MLFENDGSSSDVINAYAEMFGDGAIMDSFRRKMAREQDGLRSLEQKEIAETAARVNECKARKVENSTGLKPIASIPLRLYHSYAAAFKMRCDEVGIVLEGNGYECWSDEDFLDWFARRYPQLCFTEAQRNARIVVNDTPLIIAA